MYGGVNWPPCTEIMGDKTFVQHWGPSLNPTDTQGYGVEEGWGPEFLQLGTGGLSGWALPIRSCAKLSVLLASGWYLLLALL